MAAETSEQAIEQARKGVTNRVIKRLTKRVKRQATEQTTKSLSKQLPSIPTNSSALLFFFPLFSYFPASCPLDDTGLGSKVDVTAYTRSTKGSLAGWLPRWRHGAWGGGAELPTPSLFRAPLGTPSLSLCHVPTSCLINN